MECMCAVCHGPIPKTKQPITGVTCQSMNCRSLWQRRIKHGEPVPERYVMVRATYAWRREHEALLARLQKIVAERWAGRAA